MATITPILGPLQQLINGQPCPENTPIPAGNVFLDEQGQRRQIYYAYLFAAASLGVTIIPDPDLASITPSGATIPGYLGYPPAPPHAMCEGDGETPKTFYHDHICELYDLPLPPHTWSIEDQEWHYLNYVEGGNLSADIGNPLRPGGSYYVANPENDRRYYWYRPYAHGEIFFIDQPPIPPAAPSVIPLFAALGLMGGFFLGSGAAVGRPRKKS